MMISDRLKHRLKNAYSVCVVTGAGISAASGVPTFRGEEGLWKKFRPEELANFDAFAKNPDLVWEWYRWRRKLIQEVKPNLAHYALVDIEKIFGNFNLITQNVDNLHQKAGSKNIIELHGNILKNKCAKCGLAFENEFPEAGEIPKCSECNGLIRPDVVWFGELLAEEAVNAAQNASMNAEVLFSIGTSSIVEPAASLPYLGKGNGAYLVEINIEETPLTNSADEFIKGAADKILPELVIQLKAL